MKLSDQQKEEGITVLSLFDGMSCGQLALQKCGIKVKQYFASEVDKHAIKVAQANFPDTIQLGDVTKVKGGDLPKIDLLLGGSPCTGFSFAGKGLNFNDPQSKLFFHYVRLKNECNPTWFLLENVKMKKEHELVISKYMGIAPIEINSALVSAQNRVRLYWTNIASGAQGLFGDIHCQIKQPKDLGILLKDILEENVAEKYYISQTALDRILRRNYSNAKVDPDKTGTLNTKNNSAQLSVDSGTTLITDNAIGGGVEVYDAEKSPPLSAHDGCAHDNKIVQRARGFNKGGDKTDGKSPTLISNAWEQNNFLQQTGIVNNDGELREVDKSLCIDANYHKGCDNHGQRTMIVAMRGRNIRRLTERECERLQAVPDDYTNHVSSTQRYRMLGNGWTIDVIAHILSHIQ